MPILLGDHVMRTLATEFIRSVHNLIEADGSCGFELRVRPTILSAVRVSYSFRGPRKDPDLPGRPLPNEISWKR